MSDLHELPTETLRRLAGALSQDGEVSGIVLEGLGLDSTRLQIDAALSRVPAAARRSVVDAIVRERTVARARAPELVWTGPEADVAEARRSAVVLRKLFEGAQRRVVLAGYSFDHGDTLLAPLHEVMGVRQVKVDFFVNINQPTDAYKRPLAMTETDAAAEVAKAASKLWPWEDVRPRFFYDRRVLDGGVFCSVHAKCVVVDGERAYVTSANFTERGNERNVEAGVLLHDRSFAARLEGQLVNARRAGWFVEAAP